MNFSSFSACKLCVSANPSTFSFSVYSWSKGRPEEKIAGHRHAIYLPTPAEYFKAFPKTR